MLRFIVRYVLHIVSAIYAMKMREFHASPLHKWRFSPAFCISVVIEKGIIKLTLPFYAISKAKYHTELLMAKGVKTCN